MRFDLQYARFVLRCGYPQVLLASALLALPLSASGQTPVGGTSATQSVTLKFAQATTLNSTLATAIQFVTQGTPNLDFQYVTGGTCLPGTSYPAAQTCTVFFTFNPIVAGQRPGAVQLYDNQSTPVLAAFAYIGGTATGPLMLYKPTENTGDGPFYTPDHTFSLVKNGFVDAVTDAAGNIYVARTDNNTIEKIGPVNPLNYTYSTATIATTAYPPGGVTIDGNGTVYYVDNQGSIYSVSNGSSVLVTGQNCCNASGLVTDLAGNLYNLYFGNFLYKINPATGAITNFRLPSGSNYQYMTFDASGNLLLSEANEVDELTASQVSGTVYAALTPTQISANGMLGTPSGLAVDPAGNIYVANQPTGSNNELIEIAAGTRTQTAIQTDLTLYSADDTIAFLKISATGEFYVGDASLGYLEHFGWNTPYLVTGQPDSLGSAALGSSKLSSTKYLLENDGNAPAVLTAPSSLTGNAAVGGSNNTCTPATTVAIDATCVMGFNMTPQAAGTVLDTVALTANNQGASPSLYPLNVSITATKGSQTIAFPNPGPLPYSTGNVTLGATASSGLAVSYTVNSGPATVSGSTLTLSGAGTVVVTGSQAGNANYSAATSVQISIVITQGTAVITWVPVQRIRPGVAIGTGPLDATANISGTFAYTATLPGGSPVAITSTSTLAAGVYSVNANFTPADATDYLSNSAALSFTVTASAIFIGSSAGTVASLFDTGATASAATSGGGIGAAVDAFGDVWSINTNGSAVSRFTDAGTPVGTYSVGGIAGAKALAMDGNHHVWIANANSISELTDQGLAVTTTPLASGANINSPTSIAIDAAGKLWIVNNGNNTITKVFGAASPVATPIASDTRNGTPAALP